MFQSHMSPPSSGMKRNQLFNPATPHYIPEERNLHSHRCENLILQLHLAACSLHCNTQICKQGNNSAMQIMWFYGSVRINSWTSFSSSHPASLRSVLTLSYHLLLGLTRICFLEFSPSKSDDESHFPIRIACFSCLLNSRHTILEIGDLLPESSLLYDI
jgi:hypothetical protein